LLREKPGRQGTVPDGNDPRHRLSCLSLLPSGPDEVHSRLLRGGRPERTFACRENFAGKTKKSLESGPNERPGSDVVRTIKPIAPHFKNDFSIGRF